MAVVAERGDRERLHAGDLTLSTHPSRLVEGRGLVAGPAHGSASARLATRPGSVGGGSPTSELPAQFDLQFGAVVLDLEFHFELHLVGDVRDEP